jgi:hypothetical protein
MKKIKNVLYSLDANGLLNSRIANRETNFSVLYDDNIYNDWQAYTNYKKFRVCHKWKRKKNCTVADFDFDLSPKRKNESGRFGIENFNKERLDVILALSANNKGKCQDNFNNYTNNFELLILNTIRQNPDTKFILLATPYTRFALANINDCNYNNYTKLLKYIVNLEQKNLFLYAFENEDFLDDFNNYSDTSHYSIEINNFMLRQIGKGKNLLTKDNVDEYIRVANRKRKECDVEGIKNKARELLKLKKFSLSK